MSQTSQVTVIAFQSFFKGEIIVLDVLHAESIVGDFMIQSFVISEILIGGGESFFFV